MAKTKHAKRATEILKLYQNKFETTEVPYDEIVQWAKDNGYLVDVEPISPEQQLKVALHEVVRKATWRNPQGNKVRLYGIPRMMIQGELFTLSPVNMRYAKPDIAETVLNANFEGIKNYVKRHSIEKQSYDENNFFDAELPGYDYDFNHIADNARMSGEYDDSYDEDGLDDNNDGDDGDNDE